MSEQRVRLMIDDEILDNEFKEIGGKDAFIKSIQDGPEWFGAKAGNLSDICRLLHHQWQIDPKPKGYPKLIANAPPFLPYLCLFSYVWHLEGDFHASNFHKRLSSVFPDHDLKRNQNMKWVSDHLWTGLSKWSYKQDGNLGVFKIDRLGNMAHVGISHAQAIFRPAEIEVFPDIFSICGLRPEDSEDINDIHEALVLNQQSWSYRLSRAIPPLIINWDTSKNPIAEAALRIIAEELADWDGESNQSAARYQPSTKIFRSLKDQNGRLHLDLCVLDDDVAKLTELDLFSDDQLVGRFKTEGPRVAILQQTDNRWDPYTIGPARIGNAYSHDDDFGDEEYLCKWIPRSISLFQLSTSSSRIIETDSPPQAGDCFCLISPEGEKDFNNWIEECPVNPSTLIPTTGIKKDWLLYRLSKVEQVDMNTFPLERRASNTRNLIKLTGGTRFALNSFMDYDLPVLSAIESGVTFEIVGARKKEIPSSDRTQNQWNSARSIQYTLEDYDGNGEILITAKQGNYSQDFTIEIKHSSDLPGNLRRRDTTFFVDNFGWPSESGLRGCHVTESEDNIAAHKFYELSTNGSRRKLAVREIQSDRLHFWEALCLKKRFNYSELKSHAMHLCSLSEGEFFRAIRLMRDLGDIDVCIEDSGSISYIYPNAAELVLMPWKEGSKYVAVIRGTYNVSGLNEFLQTAESLGMRSYYIELDQDLQTTLPPSIYFEHDDLIQFNKLCERTNLLEWRNSLACRGLAEWSNNVDDWSVTLSGRPERNLYGDCERIFDADKFRFRSWDNNETREKYELFLLTVRAGRFKLPPIVNFRKSIHSEDNEWITMTDVSVRDPAWAKWYIQYMYKGPPKGEIVYQNAEVDSIPVLYNEAEMQLVLPRELTLPYILSRALTLCSGQPPKRIGSIGTDYEDIVGNFRGFQDGKGYKGELWVYSEVSKEIAELILNKVEAFPAEIEHIDFHYRDEIILSEYY